MSSSNSHVIEGWKRLNYAELLRDLDRSVTEVAKRQDESDASRKRLVELSREYKRNTHEDIRRPVAPLLKKFQTEIDDLSKRAKTVETALLDVFKKLIDVPDPVPALEHAVSVQKKLQRMQDIEIENKQLRDTLDEYNTEFAEVKNQEVTIKQLREKIRELEEDTEETVAARGRERERELATRYGDLERELSERQMEVASKLGETELKNKTLQSALEKTQTELIELKMKYEEVTAAKTDEIEILEGDIDKANERATSLERENQALRERLGQLRSDRTFQSNNDHSLDVDSTEEMMRRTEVEMELSSKEKEITQLVDEVRRLQSALKQTQESNDVRVLRLEEELKEKREALSNLESCVNARDDYDEVKRELDVLRAIEFNTTDSSDGSTGEKGMQAIKPKPLEQLLVEKNKSLQNEVTQLKVTNHQQITSSSSTISTLPSSSPSVLESCSPIIPTVSVPLSPPPASNSTTNTFVQTGGNSTVVSYLGTISSNEENNEVHSDLSSFAYSSNTTSVADAVTQMNSVNSSGNTLFVTNDSIPPLNTFKVAQRVREVLSAHNIGQRLFARHVLGLSQGTVSELLSKPKTWDKLTEKGRDSYRRMFSWVGNNDQVLALKALSPRKGYSMHFNPSPTTTTASTGNTTHVVVSANPNNREDQATEEKINAILNEAKKAMDSGGGAVDQAHVKEVTRVAPQPPQILPKNIPNNGGLLPFVDVNTIEAAIKMINCMKPVCTTSAQIKVEPTEKSINEEISSNFMSSDSGNREKNLNFDDTKNATMSTDATSLVRRIYYEELCKISANATHVGDKASFDKYQEEINRLERDHPELKEPNNQISKECMTEDDTVPVSTSSANSSVPISVTAISPLVQMTQITKSLGGMTTPFARTLFFGEPHNISTGPCDLSRNSNSPSASSKPTLQPLTQDFLEAFEPICTETIVSKIKDLLSVHSISQRVFGDHVLGLSQGSVSDLLARPKAWNMLTHKGREPFIRMKLFLDDPVAINVLIQSSNPNPNPNPNSNSSSTNGVNNSNTSSNVARNDGVISPAIRPADPVVISKLADTTKAKQAGTIKLCSPSPPPSSLEIPLPLTKSSQSRESMQAREQPTKRSSQPLCDNMSNVNAASIYELAKTSGEVDTVAVSNCIKEVLQINNLGQRLFGEVVLGLSQGSVSELLSKPKPWSQLSIKGREPYIRMQKWLDDVRNNGAVDKLKEKQKELKGSRCSKRNQDCLYDSPTGPISSGGKKPRVVFSESQKHVLLSVYNREPYPSSATLDELSRHLNLPLKTINNWFHNHRMRTKLFTGPSTSPSPGSDSPSAPPLPILTHSPGPLSSNTAASAENEFAPYDLRINAVKQEAENESDLATFSGPKVSVQTSNYQTNQPVNKRKRTNPTRITIWKEEPVESCNFNNELEFNRSNEPIRDLDYQTV